MPIRPPSLDDRSFDDLVSELLARIPAHTPEWTDPRPGDPGRTVLELFAWLTDTLLYRVNLSPEKQRLAFLQLLGIPLKPALAAQGLICLELTSPTDTQTYRLRPLARLKGPVDFETCDELTVLPLSLQVYVKQKLSVSETARYAEVVQGLSRIYNLTASQQAAPYFTTPIFSGGRPEAGGFSAASRTVDGCFWLALLASRQENQATHNQAVRQALDGASDGRALLLNIGVLPSLALPSDFADFGSRQQVPHVWEISTGRQFRGEPEYLPLTVVQDSSDRLLHPPITTCAASCRRGWAAIRRAWTPRKPPTGWWPGFASGPYSLNRYAALLVPTPPCRICRSAGWASMPWPSINVRRFRVGSCLARAPARPTRKSACLANRCKRSPSPLRWKQAEGFSSHGNELRIWP